VDHLPVLVPPTGEPPEDIGTGHPMRDVTERVARDPATWDAALAATVAAYFDDLAPVWPLERTDRSELLLDALVRGGPLGGPVVELGAGTGAGTRALCERFDVVVAGELSGGMLGRLDAPGSLPVQLDAANLPFRDRSVGTVVCMNMFLFADEVRRVLRDDGALVWVNSIGERTPIHLPAEAVAEALGPQFEYCASRVGWGTWAVARRRPG
jgi:hypothetical protein